MAEAVAGGRARPDAPRDKHGKATEPLPPGGVHTRHTSPSAFELPSRLGGEHRAGFGTSGVLSSRSLLAHSSSRRGVFDLPSPARATGLVAPGPLYVPRVWRGIHKEYPIRYRRPATRRGWGGGRRRTPPDPLQRCGAASAHGRGRKGVAQRASPSQAGRRPGHRPVQRRRRAALERGRGGALSIRGRRPCLCLRLDGGPATDMPLEGGLRLGPRLGPRLGLRQGEICSKNLVHSK